MITGDLHHPDVRLDMLEIQGMLAGIELDKIKQKRQRKSNIYTVS